MENTVECKNYLDENSPGFVVEYRGNFKEEIDKVDYACGDIINENLAVISVEEKNLDRLRKMCLQLFLLKQDLFMYYKIHHLQM